MNTSHLTEEEVSLLLLSPEQLSTQQREVFQLHLASCDYCEEYHRNMREFYTDVELRLKESPSAKDEELAEKLLERRARLRLPLRALEKRTSDLIDAYAEIVTANRRPLPQRIADYARAHPVRLTGAITSAAVAVVLAVFFIRPARDSNPVYAELKNGSLIVQNRTGEVLWTKDAAGSVEGSTKKGFTYSTGEIVGEQPILISDIDGDGLSEVLVRGCADIGASHLSFRNDSLYCFEWDGRTRWTRGYPDNIFASTFEYTKWGQWSVSKCFTLRSNHSQPRLFVTASCDPYFASKIMEVDCGDGHVVQTYWHAGAFALTTIADIDGDGKTDIVIAGVNNGYKRAFVLALDPDHLVGCGPAPSQFFPRSATPGSQKYYCLLPRTDISEKFSSIPYNSPTFLYPAQGSSHIVCTRELFDKPGSRDVCVLFTIGSKLKVMNATWTDPFLKEYDALLSDGKVKKSLSSEYWENLKNSALYWDGERFVKEAVTNKHYLQSLQPH